LGTEEKRGTMFRSSTDEIFETLNWNKKTYKEKNQCIRGKKGAQNTVTEIKQYQKKWLQHVQRMDTNRTPKQALQYRPKRLRNIGRPRKRWRDQLHLED
jgi:restriction endonuclease Mrr